MPIIIAILASSPLRGFAVPGTAGCMSVEEVGDRFLCMTWAGQSLVLVGADGSERILFELRDSGFESISEPAESRGRIAFTGRGSSSAEIVVLDTAGVRLASYGPYAEAGPP